MQRKMSYFVVFSLCLVLLELQLNADEKKELSPEQVKIVAKIKQAGGSVLQIAQNDPRLEVAFHLSDKKITGKQLSLVKQLKNVIHLNLRGTEITDKDLVHLKGLTTLTRLHLEKTKITDAGLVHLKDLTNLEYLNLYATGVTDKGLAHLKGMKKLQKLYVWQTKVTEAGVKQLKKALPKLTIVRGIAVTTPKKPEKGKDKKK